LYILNGDALEMRIDHIVFTDQSASKPPKTQPQIFDLADSKTGWTGHNPITVVDAVYGQGLSGTGAGVDQFEKDLSKGNTLSTTYIDAGVSEASGYFQFWYYISDVEAYDGVTGRIELRSSGS